MANQEAMKGVQVFVALTLFTLAVMTYGLRDALLVFFVLNLLLGFSALLGFIPLVGPYFYWRVASDVMLPTFFAWFPALEPSWLTTALFWLGMVSSVGFTFASVAALTGAGSQ